MTRLMPVFMLGKKINVDTTVSQIKKVIEVAKMFNTKIKLVDARKGERYASALTNMNLSNKVYKIFSKISLKNYIKTIINSQKQRLK